MSISSSTLDAFEAKNQLSRQFLSPTLEGIVSVQEQGGAVPELEGGIVEPWTHVECAMAIDAGNFRDEAEKAYEWLADVQLADGSWYANYRNGRPKDMYKVSHAISYIAVGIWHHYLINNDVHFVDRMWPCIRSAIDYIPGDARPQRGNILGQGCRRCLVSIGTDSQLQLLIFEHQVRFKDGGAYGRRSP